MIVRAIERGVSEDKLAKALDLDIKAIRRRRLMLSGICPEVVDLLKDKSLNPTTFALQGKQRPARGLLQSLRSVHDGTRRRTPARVPRAVRLLRDSESGRKCQLRPSELEANTPKGIHGCAHHAMMPCRGRTVKGAFASTRSKKKRACDEEVFLVARQRPVRTVIRGDYGGSLRADSRSDSRFLARIGAPAVTRTRDRRLSLHYS